MARAHDRDTTPSAAPSDDPLVLGGRTFHSRMIVGTGKYRDFAETRRCIEASGAEIVTVAVRRVNITDAGKENLLDHLDPKRFVILPNTAGCYTAAEAIRVCRLTREAGADLGFGDMVKLEVIGDDKTLFPDVAASVAATSGKSVLSSPITSSFTIVPKPRSAPASRVRRQTRMASAAV